jgi:hypothetical protein
VSRHQLRRPHQGAWIRETVGAGKRQFENAVEKKELRVAEVVIEAELFR